MKALLKTGVFFVLISLFTLNISAQVRSQEKQRVNSTEQREKRVNRMTKALGLSADQQAKIKAIDKKFFDQQKAKREEAKADRKARREEIAKTREAREAEIKAVLTSEQYDQWKASRKDAIKKGNKDKKEPGRRSQKKQS